MSDHTELVYCTINESIQSDENVVPVLGEKFAAEYESLARAVTEAREILTVGLYPIIMRQEFRDLLSLLDYACEHPARRKREPMDVEKMVETWVPLVRKLATAHDIDEKDAASFNLDELLLPVVAAPVAQVREFYRKVIAKMKADRSIPWAVWSLFEFWGTNVLDKITKEQEVQLKTEIAKRIAEHSIAEIPREDWVNSMVGALQWRSPEKLEAIESGLKAGQKPRVRGRESCLFLEVGEAEVML